MASLFQCVTALLSIKTEIVWKGNNRLELQDLLGMTHSIAQLQKHETLFGGVANHGDVFQPVYCMLLALHTAGQSTHVRAKLPSVLGSVQTAAAGLSDVASQPVIAAMLKTTLAVCSAPDAPDSSEVCEIPLSLFHWAWWLSARPWLVPPVKEFVHACFCKHSVVAALAIVHLTLLLQWVVHPLLPFG